MNNSEKRARARDRSRSFLPLDIIHDIVFRLPAKSIARFRSVSKSWNAMTSDPSFVRSHAAHAAHAAGIFTLDPDWKRNDLINFYILPTSSDVHHGVETQINKPDDKATGFDEVLSCHGMVCIHGANTRFYYICNPLTAEWIATVYFPYRRCVWGFTQVGYVCAFYFHAPTGEYRLLGVFGNHLVPRKLELRVLTLGTNTWRPVNSSGSSFRGLRGFGDSLTLDGKVHWGTRKFINFFDTVSEEFQEILPPSSPNEDWDFEGHLVEIEGRLGLYEVTSETRMNIWVLKGYTREGEWIKRHTISFEGIPAAPYMYDLSPLLPLISSNPLLPMVSPWDGGSYVDEGEMYVYDLELKQLKKMAPLLHQSRHCVPYAETLMSSNSLNLHPN